MKKIILLIILASMFMACQSGPMVDEKIQTAVKIIDNQNTDYIDFTLPLIKESVKQKKELLETTTEDEKEKKKKIEEEIKKSEEFIGVGEAIKKATKKLYDWTCLDNEGNEPETTKKE